MGLSAQEKKSFKDSLKDAVDQGQQLYNKLIELLEDEDYYGKITKNEAVEIVNEVVPETAKDYTRQMSRLFPAMGENRLSTRESRARSELSRKALKL